MAKEKFETITLKIPKGQYEWLTQYCKQTGFTIQEVFSLRLTEFKQKTEKLQKKRTEQQVLTTLERIASEKGLSVSDLITVMAKG